MLDVAVAAGDGLPQGLVRADENLPVQAPIAPAVIESNPRWQEALDVANQIDVAAVVVQSALVREETRGVHFRNDHPDRDDAGWLRYIVARADDDRLELDARAVALDRITPEQGEDS